MYQRRTAGAETYPSAVPGRSWVGRSAALLALLLLTACVRPEAAAPAVIRSTAPPWDAPRDGISYIEAAGLTPQPLNTTGTPHIVSMAIVVDGWAVPIPAYVGVDRLRAQQAAVHTHDTTNQVWLEGRDTAGITLSQFFRVWGVRFTADCLGAACEEVTVLADDQRVADPLALRLVEVRRITITARS
jgi:hypothetical protein